MSEDEAYLLRVVHDGKTYMHPLASTEKGEMSLSRESLPEAWPLAFSKKEFHLGEDGVFTANTLVGVAAGRLRAVVRANPTPNSPRGREVTEEIRALLAFLERKDGADRLVLTTGDLYRGTARLSPRDEAMRDIRDKMKKVGKAMFVPHWYEPQPER